MSSASYAVGARFATCHSDAGFASRTRKIGGEVMV